MDNNTDIKTAVEKGGKFVIYYYTISIIFMTFKRPSKVYFVEAGESDMKNRLLFSLITLLLGWWGIPWGPIYTIQSLYVNLTGGKNVTEAVMNGQPVQEEENN